MLLSEVPLSSTSSAVSDANAWKSPIGGTGGSCFGEERPLTNAFGEERTFAKELPLSSVGEERGESLGESLDEIRRDPPIGRHYWTPPLDATRGLEAGRLVDPHGCAETGRDYPRACVPGIRQVRALAAATLGTDY